MSRTKVTGADLTWLHMDRPDNPMMITGLLWFDRPMDRLDLAALLDERLVQRFPKFAQRVVRQEGAAFWEADPAFEVAAHIHRVALPQPGGHAGLQTLVGQAMSTRLDPDRAPWHVDLIEDFEGGSAIVVRLHHVIADGISLARVLLQLADSHEVLPRPPRQGRAAAVSGMVRGLWTVGRSWFTDPSQILRHARTGLQGAEALAELLALPADPPNPFRSQLGVRKVARWLDPLDLARVKAIGRRHEATVNDVLLAALGVALDGYLRDRGSAAQRLRTFVPVNLRALDAPMPTELGNRFGLVLLDLPLGYDDPAVALREMRRRTEVMKGSPQAVVTYATLQAMASAPERVAEALAGYFANRASLITTNVPGPRERITIGGRSVAGILCWVPQSSGVGLGVSILSYAGEVRVGVAADAQCVPDADRLAERYAWAITAMEDAEPPS